MAKKLKDLKEKKVKDSITTQQYNNIKDVEDYIDTLIELQWESGAIITDYRIATFQINPITLNPTGYDEELRRKMSEILNLRFQDQGWRIRALSLYEPKTIDPDTWMLSPKI